MGKKLLLIIMVLCLTLVTSTVFANPKIPLIPDSDVCFGGLRTGMTEEQVVSLLGPAEKVTWGVGRVKKLQWGRGGQPPDIIVDFKNTRAVSYMIERRGMANPKGIAIGKSILDLEKTYGQFTSNRGTTGQLPFYALLANSHTEVEVYFLPESKAINHIVVRELLE